MCPDGNSEGAWLEKRIGAEQNEVAPAGCLEGGIIGGSKAEVRAGAQESDLRKFFFSHLG
jgi:hypothetical protein